MSEIEVTLGLIHPNGMDDGSIEHLQTETDEYGDATMRLHTDGELTRISVRILDGDTRMVYLFEPGIPDFTEIRDNGEWRTCESDRM